MRKLLVTLLVMLLAGSLLAVGTSRGASPQSQTADVTVLIPNLVAIYLNNNVTFDFSNITANPSNSPYPPDVFPAWYLPTSPSASPYESLTVWTNNPSGWTLTTKGSGDFATTLPLSDLYYAPDGEPKTADGSATAGGNWVAFSSTDQTVASSATKTSGWEEYNQDYEIMLDGDEEPGTYTVTITYTITGN